MKINTLALGALGSLSERVRAADYSPLMERWERTITADNRKGILAGLDRDGNPLPPVTYRPKDPSAKVANRKADRGFKGFGPLASGLNGNLTPAQYRLLAGPPTAPRGANSRVITNLATRHGRESGIWFAEAAWLDVVSVKGVPFLQYLLKRFRIDGVRPDGREKASAQLKAFVLSVLKLKAS